MQSACKTVPESTATPTRRGRKAVGRSAKYGRRTIARSWAELGPAFPAPDLETGRSADSSAKRRPSVSIERRPDHAPERPKLREASRPATAKETCGSGPAEARRGSPAAEPSAAKPAAESSAAKPAAEPSAAKPAAEPSAAEPSSTAKPADRTLSTAEPLSSKVSNRIPSSRIRKSSLSKVRRNNKALVTRAPQAAREAQGLKTRWGVAARPNPASRERDRKSRVARAASNRAAAHRRKARRQMEISNPRPDRVHRHVARLKALPQNPLAANNRAAGHRQRAARGRENQVVVSRNKKSDSSGSESGAVRASRRASSGQSKQGRLVGLRAGRQPDGNWATARPGDRAGGGVQSHIGGGRFQ